MADILIRGMEIPKEPTNITIYPDGCWCDYTSNDSHGKFVVLPEGHGRLIDADVLMEIIRAHDYPLTAHFNSIDFGMFTLGIQQAVDEVPTIVPAEGGGEDGN